MSRDAARLHHPASRRIEKGRFLGLGHAVKRRLRRLLRIPPEVRLYVDKEMFYRYARERMRPDAVYVEVGAGPGNSAQRTTAFLGLASERCHLVEACPTNIGVLREKLPNAKAYNYAVSDRLGHIPLYVVDKPTDEGSSRSNTIDSKALRAKTRLPVKEILVPSITMGAFFDQAGIARCDLLYMNCEGAEYEVLRGDVSFLDRVFLFSLDLHKGLFGSARTDEEMVEARLAIYDLLESRGFVQIGGHKRKHLEGITSIHMTSFWENESLPYGSGRGAARGGSRP